MSATSSSPGASDLISKLLARVGLPQLEDEIRALLIVLGGEQSDVNLTAALVGVFMIHSATPRAAAIQVVQRLSILSGDKLDDDSSTVMIMDGSVIFIPGPSGQFHKLADFAVVEPNQVPAPLVTAVFHTRHFFRLVQSVR